MRRPLIGTFLLLAGFVVLAGASRAQDAQAGAAIYARHCATCHGSDAQGGGPMAAILTLQPPDLTGLTERNAGVFPMTRAVSRIDGRDPRVAHGSPMPVYGDFFEGVQSVPLKAETGQPILVSEGVADLVAFLQVVQR